MPSLTSRSGRRVAVVASALALSIGGAAFAATRIDGSADVPTRSAVRVDPPQPALVVGDSAIAALRWVPGADNAMIGFEHTLDLESCRRLATPSCRGREQRVPTNVVEALAVHGDNYHTLVVATGYNDATTAFASGFTEVVSRARSLGYSRIVWWTLRSDVDYVSPGSVGNHETFERNNAVLRDLLATGAHPDVVLADWDGYTDDRAEWFVTDGVHYRAVGAWAASDYLSRKMAYLDGRACPMPYVPGGPRPDPCPDPDLTGPLADIEALYPIGEDGVLCYEIGAERRVECRFDTHVIQLTRELSEGMSGPDVSALQTRLARLGFLQAGTSGQFGAATRAAVETFQGSEGLPASGVADVATLDALGFDVSGIG